MGIKDRLKLYPWDKLSHYQWASWFATAAALVTMVGAHSIDLPIHQTALAGAIAGVAVAVLAGVAGELSDKIQSNDDAAADAETAPRKVERKDILASALGALPVSLPLLLVFVIT